MHTMGGGLEVLTWLPELLWGMNRGMRSKGARDVGETSVVEALRRMCKDMACGYVPQWTARR